MTKRLHTNNLVSVAAIVVSVCALFVTVYQTVLMRGQKSAAVWPKLVIAHGFLQNAGDDSFYRLSIRNVGIGPAVIRNVEISHKGQRFANMVDYAQSILPPDKTLDNVAYDWTDLSPGDVVPHGERVYLFDTHKSRFADDIIAGRKSFRLTITYASIYGEEWQTVYPK